MAADYKSFRENKTRDQEPQEDGKMQQILMKKISPLKRQLYSKLKRKKVGNKIKRADSRLKTIHTGWPILFNCHVGGL